jgi:glycosyltransferase involved in cell wall biosynthesis
MKEKIRILFHTLDQAGVQYFRVLSPSIQLDNDHSENFYVEINNEIDFKKPETLDYLKSFDIIHYHRQLLPDTRQMVFLAEELRKSGVVLVVDNDDFWRLNLEHPLYQLHREKKLEIPIIENLKIADYVTTTTELFAKEIRKVTGKDNVIVLPNAIEPENMTQFKNNWKPDPEGKVRITYSAGSSHLNDLQQLKGVFNILHANPEIKDKFRITLAGFDCMGTTQTIEFNQKFSEELQQRNLWTPQIVKFINKTRGNVDMIPRLPDDLKNKYRNNVFTVKERDIKSEESVYFEYEKILTDNHNIIENKDYLRWLMNFERNVDYPFGEQIYKRIWTQKANIYAKVLDQADIVLSPLADNEFNHYKSNLKQVECWSRKLPIICSGVSPYIEDGKHMENCILIPPKKNAHQDWAKWLKRLILDKDLREKLGNQLYEDFKEKYHLANVTNKRAEFYKSIIKK